METISSSQHAGGRPRQQILVLQLLNIFFFIGNILMNTLANTLPLNGKSTGQLSAQYPNLFTPAPITFSIWGIIYSLLLAFCIFQTGVGQRKDSKAIVHAIVDRMGLLFIATNICGSAWLLAWHYEYVGLSVGIMLFFLLVLISIHQRFKMGIRSESKIEKWLVHLPFSIYLGWISVATVANITAWLVDRHLDVDMGHPVSWTILMLGIVIALTKWMLWRFNALFYGLTIVWALVGICIVRYADQQMEIVIAAIIGIALTGITCVFRFRKWLSY